MCDLVRIYWYICRMLRIFHIRFLGWYYMVVCSEERYVEVQFYRKNSQFCL